MSEPYRQDTQRYPASRILDVAKALSGDVRVRILEALGRQPMSISQLAESLGVAQPTISINVQILEQAELIVSSPGPTGRKSARLPAAPFSWNSRPSREKGSIM